MNQQQAHAERAHPQLQAGGNYFSGTDGYGNLQWAAYDPRVREFLEALCNFEREPWLRVAPWRIFVLKGYEYYFTPGGFLYRKQSDMLESDGMFCGFVSDDVWHKRMDGPLRQQWQHD